jgi:hypothetical protein
MIPNLTILPFRSNWSSPITLKSTFATNVKRESIPGSITRDSARDYGQREIKFSILPYDDSRRTWDAFREENPPGTILGIPLWCEEGVYLTADVAIGATSLSVSSVNFIDWRNEAVLWRFDDSACEGLQIEAISGTTITLSAALQSAFQAGDQILPLMRGYQIDEYAEELDSYEISAIELTFEEDLAHASAPSMPGTLNTATYLGLPVLPLIAEWSEAPKINVGQGTHISSSGINRQALATLRQFIRQRISHRVGCDGRQDRATIWQFFHDRGGRWQRFWLPSFKNELLLAADVGASDTTLQLKNFSSFTSRFNYGGQLRRAIFITNGDQWWIRQVINLSGGTNRVTIDAAIGMALPASMTKIGLLPLVQFATDDIEIECQSPLVSTATLTFTELEREYADVITTGTARGTIKGMELASI